MKKIIDEIKDILICSQYRHWIDMPDRELTAEESKQQNERARQYYLKTMNYDKELLKRIRFCALINLQTAYIKEVLKLSRH